MRRNIITLHLMPTIGDMNLTQCATPQQVAQLKAGFHKLGPQRTNQVQR